MGFEDFLQDIGGSLAGTATAMGEFGGKKLGPAMTGTSNALRERGANQLGSTRYNYGEWQVAPASSTRNRWITPSQAAMIAYALTMLAILGLTVVMIASGVVMLALFLGFMLAMIASVAVMFALLALVLYLDFGSLDM